MRNAAVLLLVALSALSGAAQEQFFSESIDVRIINVDVIVTDRKGAPVPGLTKDDFELRENGAPKEITNFEEYRGAGAPSIAPSQRTTSPDARPRRIVIFLDESSLRTSARNRVFPAMKSFVASSVRLGDTVMIALWRPGLIIALPMTSDASAVGAKLDAIASTGTQARLAIGEERDAEVQITSLGRDKTQTGPKGLVVKPSISEGIARAQTVAMKALHEQHEKVEAMKSVMASLRGVEGRKVFVFVTESLSELPGRAAFEHLELVKDLYEGGQYYSAETEAAQFRDRDLISSLAQAANGSGVSIYPIHATGLGGANEAMSAEQSRRRIDRASTADNPLHEIASATGGVALTSSDNFQLAFDTIANDLTSYYSLGYRADDAKEDAIRALDVKLKKKGYSIRTRQSSVEKSLHSEMADAVAANLFYPIERNDLRIAMTAGAKNAVDAEHSRVPVELKIPTAKLTLLPDGKDLTGKFSTYAAFVRGDGVVSQVKMQTLDLRFPAESLARRKEITLKLDVTIDNATDGLSIGVLDNLSRTTGFVTAKVASK